MEPSHASAGSCLLTTEYNSMSNFLHSQSVLTGRDEHGDGAGLSVGGAAGVVTAVGRLHRGDHQSAARLPAVLP